MPGSPAEPCIPPMVSPGSSSCQGPTHIHSNEQTPTSTCSEQVPLCHVHPVVHCSTSVVLRRLRPALHVLNTACISFRLPVSCRLRSHPLVDLPNSSCINLCCLMPRQKAPNLHTRQPSSPPLDIHSVWPSDIAGQRREACSSSEPCSSSCLLSLRSRGLMFTSSSTARSSAAAICARRAAASSSAARARLAAAAASSALIASTCRCRAQGSSMLC